MIDTEFTAVGVVPVNVVEEFDVVVQPLNTPFVELEPVP